MAVQRLGLHVHDVDNAAVIGNECGAQGQKGVLHPKALLGGLLKHKEHALVLGHFFSEHQTRLSLLGGECDLGIDHKEAGLYFDALKVKLWRFLCSRSIKARESA